MAHDFQNLDWKLPKENPHSFDKCQLAVLMDIREHLKEIDKSLRPLRCTNFLLIPHKLDAIHRKIPTRRQRKKSL